MNQAIYAEIKQRILSLEYQPGQILNEKVLAAEFGVSRTPLREVLSKLEWDQLVRILPRTGTMVTEIEFQKMMNTYQIRFEIEELVGRLSAEQSQSDYITAMNKLAKACRRLRKEKNPGELVVVDRKFRDILFKAANNPILTDIAQQLYELTLRLWYTTLERGDWSLEVDSLVEEIDQTSQAWRRKSPLEAGRLRRANLEKHFERIRAKFLGLPI